MNPNLPSTIVIIATGGTIAGGSADPLDNVGYTAGQRSVAQLLAAVPALAGQPLAAEQLAQLDSKDMDHATWQRLAASLQQWLARPEVAGAVITHGTDTLEETAWLLQRVLAPTKPVVLTAAMRPATALMADGPQNLLDAVALTRTPGARGVLVAVAGQVFAAGGVRKQHPYRVDAFAAPDGGPMGVMEEGRLRRFRDWPSGTAWPAVPGPAAAATAAVPPALEPTSSSGAAPGLSLLPTNNADWPWVEIVASHAGARPAGVAALVAAGVQGLVVACTGNGTVNAALLPALDAARASGVTVWRCSRCAEGAMVGAVGEPAAAMSPWQARVELVLALLAQRAGFAGAGPGG